EVLVVVIIDLGHRRVHAGAEAFDFYPGEFAVSGNMHLLADASVADVLEGVGAAQHAGRSGTKLHVEFSNRLEIEHGVEGRDLQCANARHAEQLGDMLDRLLRQPAAGLLLRPPQEWDHRRGFPALRIFRDLRLRPRGVLRREGEALGLLLGETADGHQRSTSPNTMSSEPSTADTSASMWPRHMKSIACRWANPGARILHLEGWL